MNPMSTDSSATQLNFSKFDKCGIVLRVAIASRLLLIALIIFWRSFFSPYDTSSTLNPKCLSLDPNDTSLSTESVLWPKIGTAIEGSIVWDGVYFIRIAQCGYEYEQNYAFFPLLPICIYTLSQTVFAPLIPIIGYRAVLALSGYVINNVSFLFAAVYFYKASNLLETLYQTLNIVAYATMFSVWLSVIILKDTKAALRASILFCFNPASIFYSSIYTESLYSLFSLGGLYHLFSGANTIAVLLLALSGFSRSNGVLNAGYFCFQTMHQLYDAIFKKKHVHVLISGVVRSLCIFAPFVAFQAYGYYNSCLGGLSDEVRPWCKARVPFLYDYLQGHYWGVGFLRYFQLKQLPNFLLASPILSLALFSIVNYVKLQSAIVFSLGFRASCEEKNGASVLYSSGTNQISKDAPVSGNFSPNILQEEPTLRRRKQTNKEGVPDSLCDPVSSDHETIVPSKLGYSSILILPFILHLVFMVATAFFVMHVQVATRFLSASPSLYWFSSYLMVSPRKTSRRWGYFIWAYSAAYILLGSLLFSNFYPFT